MLSNKAIVGAHPCVCEGVEEMSAAAGALRRELRAT